MSFKQFIFSLLVSVAVLFLFACQEEEQLKIHEYIFLNVDTASITDNSVVLKWTRSNAVDFNYYQVHRSKVRGFTPSSSSSLKDIYNREQTKDTVFPLLAGTTYFFKVLLFTQDGTSTESNEASAKTISY